MVCAGGAAGEAAGKRETPGAELLEAWRQRARTAFEQLEQATSPMDAHRLRIEVIDAVEALLGIESMIASHLRARTKVDPVGRAGRARLRLALLCIASSASSERRHLRALSTIRAALWDQTPSLHASACLAADEAEELPAELSRVVATLWPLGD